MEQENRRISNRLVSKDSLYSNGKKKEEIEGFIENLTFNMNSVTKDTLLNFPLPMVTLELNGMVIWHNSLFQRLLQEDTVLERNISSR